MGPDDTLPVEARQWTSAQMSSDSGKKVEQPIKPISEAPKAEVVQGAREAYDALIAKGQELPGLTFVRPNIPDVVFLTKMTTADQIYNTYQTYGINSSEGLVNGILSRGRDGNVDFDKGYISDLKPCRNDGEIRSWQNTYDSSVSELERKKRLATEGLDKRREAVADVLSKLKTETSPLNDQVIT